jgi:hypothetical protein
MVLTPYWPDYAAFPHRVTIKVPGSDPLDIGNRDEEWLYQTLLIRDWCHDTLRGPWVFITSNDPQILTALEEDHALVELTWG